LALEPGRTEEERERSLVLHEASNRVAAAQDTDEGWAWLLTRPRLLGSTGTSIKCLEGGVLVPAAGTESTSEFLVGTADPMPTLWAVWLC